MGRDSWESDWALVRPTSGHGRALRDVVGRFVATRPFNNGNHVVQEGEIVGINANSSTRMRGAIRRGWLVSIELARAMADRDARDAVGLFRVTRSFAVGDDPPPIPGAYMEVDDNSPPQVRAAIRNGWLVAMVAVPDD